MAAGIPARLTPTPLTHKAMTAAAGRTFGLTVGGAFVGIGLVMLWRGHLTRATVVLTLGGVVALAGLVIPTRLGPVERAWMGLAHLLSKVTTPLFMGLVYFGVLTPLGVLRKLVGGGRLSPTTREASRWMVPTAPADRRERMERQF
jgi:hypothetical protein